MKNCSKAVRLLPLLLAAACCGDEPEVGARCGFDSTAEMKNGWRQHGAVGVGRKTLFTIVDEPSAVNCKVLAVEAKNSSGFLIFRLPGLDLKKHPYMRWRWRVVRKVKQPAEPAGKPDAQTVEPDDQACVIYIADGGQMNQKCVGYRWEHSTKVGVSRMINYGGVRKVLALCLRNAETPPGEWMEEERNVLEDYRKAFGRAPSARFAIIIGGNSQHTNSDTRAEIDYIEFRSAPKSAK